MHDNNTTNFDGVGVEVRGIPKVSNGRYEFTFSVNLGMTIDRNVVGDDFSIECAVYTTDLYERNLHTIFYNINDPSGGDILRVFPDVHIRKDSQYITT